MTLPNKDSLTDEQLVQVQGPDGLTTTYQYDSQTNTLNKRLSDIIIPSSHGNTHVTSDKVPNATTDSDGLMSKDDKAKLDQLLQMRVGILGFVGAGFGDDNGYISGDLLFSTGSEFLSLERVGNVVRFTVDSPIPLNCGCEDCAQIFWIQDESDTSSIRPPSCNGKLPGVNAYGEMKIYLMPETVIVDPANPTTTLNNKGNFPSLIFKRYDDGLIAGQGEFDMVLSRRPTGTTAVGWAMTPGALGVPECVWFMGDDADGNEIRFELDIESDADMLGALLYKGHTLTRKPAVITSYTTNVLTNNQYLAKYWDINGEKPITSIDEFTATNVWRYENPESSPTATTDPRELVTDATQDLLPIGTLIQLWEVQDWRIWQRTNSTSFLYKGTECCCEEPLVFCWQDLIR